MMAPPDRAVQLLRATRGLPPSDDLRGQLVQLRTHIRRRDVRGAEALIDTLIAQATGNGHAPTPKLPLLHKTSRAACPFGWKYTAKGKQTRDRRHTCGPECSWGPEKVRHWLATTPYKLGRGDDFVPRLVRVPLCANCDRRRSDHWEPAADPVTGRLTGYRAIKECDYTPAERGA